MNTAPFHLLHSYMVSQLAAAKYELIDHLSDDTGLYFDSKTGCYTIETGHAKYDIGYECTTHCAFEPIQIPRGLFLLTPGVTYSSSGDCDHPVHCCSCQTPLVFGRDYQCKSCEFSRTILRRRIIPAAITWSFATHDVLPSEIRHLILDTLCAVIVSASEIN